MRSDNLDHENRPIKYGVTPDELRQIQQRRIEAHEQQQTADTLNLARAVKLGQALKQRAEVPHG
ncbi:hypothetical protein L0Z11_12895 [Burkholderia multivorans]|uniref:hypothetical protein n=1 Tax=Burkholderia multivorans TaxID=87883 RepID=UPI002018CD3D|nr:hypothetical protein [Burkholderia multivorans]UQN68572.1 hypothetical protein L0Z45_12915 [Burkholderia multivorans]UQN74299.1 hypothetical protein L0Z11_12895 [Burkholderia multivorans]